MLTLRERALLREKLIGKPSLRWLIESRLRTRESCVIRVERAGNHRVAISVTQEDLNIALAQLTLLGKQ